MPTPPNPDVAETRRALRALLSRRDFVAATAVAGAGLVGLTACSSDSSTGTGTGSGGGGGGGGNTTMPRGAQSVTGSVTLPSGSTLKPTDLSVDIFTQTVPVSASGGFTVGISPSGPSLALLTDSGGDAVLIAMWDPASSSFEVNSRTTAVALLHFGLDGYLLPANVMGQVLALIDADPSVAAVESAVAQAVASDPHALANNAAPLAPAISTALTAMLGSNVRAAAPVVAQMRMDGAPALMTVEPSGEQNGLDVNQDTTTTSLLITNVKRRPCRAYIYETNSGTPPPGNTTPPPVSPPVTPPNLVAGPIEINSTESLGLFNSLKDLFTGTAPWSPVNLPPIPLSLDGAADQTIYEVVILAASAKWVLGKPAEPAVFGETRFANEVTTWRVDTASLLELDFVGNMCLPVLSLLLGYGAITVSQAVIAAAVAAGRASYTSAADQVLSRVRSGSVGNVRAGLIDVMVDAGENTLLTPLWKADLQQVIGRAEAAALATQSVQDTATRFVKGAAVFAKLFAVVGLALDAVDLGAVLLDFANSDLGATWTATLVRQKLILAPQNPRVSQGEHVVFQITLPPGITGNFVYDWTEDSLADTLSDSGANVGSSITTAEQLVTLVTSGSDNNPVNVLVIGYDTSSGSRVEIGRAGTTVAFLQRAAIQPASAVVDNGQQKLFSVVVDGGLPSGGQYRWTLTGTAGSIGNSNVVTTTVAAINYLGVQGGTDSLHVDVLDNTGTLYAKADASISVAGPPIIDFTISGVISAGPFTQYTQLPTGHYQFTPNYVGLREPSPDSGLDGIVMSYDNVGSGQDTSPGVFIDILLPSGAIPVAGQVLSKWTDEGNANQFQVVVSTNLINPNDPDASMGAPDGTGTLTVNAISLQDNGEWIMLYTFEVVADTGGTIIGTGTGKWGANGVIVTS
jgi:hypothetical protein